MHDQSPPEPSRAVPAPLAGWTHERFSRERLAGYDETILDARVLVIGAGAVGAAVTQQLAMWGFHRGLVVDFDTYEPSNAARTLDFPWQALHDGQAVHKATEVATHWRRRVAPWFEDTDVDARLTWAQELSPDDWLAADVVLAAVDHPRARYDIAAWARRYARPVIMGGLDALSSQVNVYVFPATAEAACYACGLREEPRYAVSVSSCTTTGLRAREARSVPATAALAGMCAALMVQRLADGLDQRTSGNTSTMKLLRIAQVTGGRLGEALELERDPDCALHDPHVRHHVVPEHPTLHGLATTLERELDADLVVPGGLPVHITTDDAVGLVRAARPAWRCHGSLDTNTLEPAPGGAYPLVLDELDADLIEHHGLDALDPSKLGLGPNARFPVRLRETGAVVMACWAPASSPQPTNGQQDPSLPSC